MAAITTDRGDNLSAPSATGDDIHDLSALATRDPRAFERLYDRWSRSTYALAHAIVGDAALAEVVIEDVFLSLWRRPEAALANSATLADHLCSAVRGAAQSLKPDQGLAPLPGGCTGTRSP